MTTRRNSISKFMFGIESLEELLRLVFRRHPKLDMDVHPSRAAESGV